MNTTPPTFYVAGGTLRSDVMSYVERRADTDLYEGLTRGFYCYVLTSRQMGKSSLMVRTSGRLRADNVIVAMLDLTAIGQNVNAEQWYEGLLGLVGQQLNLEDELEDFWSEHKSVGPLQRWMRAIREVVMTRRQGRLVIFIDEIDVVRSLPFSTDEFFAGVRECYNRRTEDKEMERLTFCLLGVATPSDLIRDTRTTPFNIGRRIELTDFTESEAAPLIKGLGRDGRLGQTLLRRILYWTGGHPYLTQQLCHALAVDKNISNTGGVDRLCEELFLSTRARERDDNLLFVRERLLRCEDADRASLLDLYLRIRRNKRIRDDETDPLVSIIHLSGIIKTTDGNLQVRNRTYYRVFDQAWVITNMPGAELRRQRAAYKRGVLRAAMAAVLVFLILGLGGAVIYQRNRAEEAVQQKNILQQEYEATLSKRKDQLEEAEERTRRLKEKSNEANQQK